MSDDLLCDLKSAIISGAFDALWSEAYKYIKYTQIGTYELESSRILSPEF